MKKYTIILLCLISITACKSKKNTITENTKNIETINYTDPKWSDSSVYYLTDLEKTKFSGLENDLEKIKNLGYNVIVFDCVLNEELIKNDSFHVFENIIKINTKFGSEKEFETLSKKAKSLHFKLLLKVEDKYIDRLNKNNSKDKIRLNLLAKNLNFWINDYYISGFYSQFSNNENNWLYLYSQIKNKEILIKNGNQFSIIQLSKNSLFLLKPDGLVEIPPIRLFDSLMNLQIQKFNFIQLGVVNSNSFVNELFYTLLPHHKLISNNQTIEIQELNNLITTNSCLWTGDKTSKYQKLNNIVSNQENVLCYKRYNDSSEVIFIINLSDKPGEVGFVDLEAYTNITEYFSSKKYDDLLNIDLNPMQYLVFVKK